jgi:hypothetical protein
MALKKTKLVKTGKMKFMHKKKGKFYTTLKGRLFIEDEDATRK